MPKLGLGLGLPTTRVSASFDPDALAYFTTAGISDATAKTQINDFVKGIKDLGLWNSMVCWPLRSSQNAGTGTTAYSLGGLGTYNGTLNNSPIWTTDGLNMEVAGRNVSTTLSISQPFTVFSIFRSSGLYGASTTQRVYGPNAQGSLTRAGGSGSSASVVASAGLNATVFTVSGSGSYGSQIEFNGASSTTSVNGGAKSAINPGTANNTGFIIGDVTARGTLNSFTAVFNTSSVALIYSTYKNTLGQGLPLA